MAGDPNKTPTLSWIVFRAPGSVGFDPESTPRIAGKPVELTTEATFSAPGVYWLRAIASDGMLETNHDVKVTVTALTKPRPRT